MAFTLLCAGGDGAVDIGSQLEGRQVTNPRQQLKGGWWSRTVPATSTATPNCTALSTREACESSVSCDWCGPHDYDGNPMPGGQCYNNATGKCCIDTGGGGHGYHPQHVTLCAADQECCEGYAEGPPLCYSPSKGEFCCSSNSYPAHICEKGTTSCQLGYSYTYCSCCNNNESCVYNPQNHREVMCKRKSTCEIAMQSLCDTAHNVSAGDCFVCCGQHQHQLNVANCTMADFHNFCS
eukprot:COSAG01_NODE_664_length_14417_cov_18.499022_5_plen_237_part_00